MIGHNDLFNAVASLRPGAKFSVRDDDEDIPHLEWDASNVALAPSDSDIAAEVARLASLQVWPGCKPQLQAAQIGLLAGGYAAAIAQPVAFTTAASVTKTFQADPASIQNLSSMLAAFTPAGAAPSGFYWVAADNTQVPFTLADMQGLAKTIGNQGWAAFQNLQARKAAVLAASSSAAIAAVVW